MKISNTGLGICLQAILRLYRYLNYGGSLSSYINSHIGFLLKDIIGWCVNEPSGNSLASNVIRYIHDNHLDVAENMEKEFVVNSIPFREFERSGNGNYF